MVEEFIFEQEAEQKEILQYLHEMLLEYPRISAKIRFKIPFYYRNSWICYLNPQKDKSIEMAFIRGNELSNQNPFLESKNRKQVKSIRLENIAQIAQKGVFEVFQEALLLDEQVPYASKRKK